MKKFGSKRRQGGFNLIELSVVMVLVGIVMLGSMKIIPNVMFSMDTSSLSAEVADVRTASISWKSSRPNFTGVGMAALCSSGRQLLTESICGTDGLGTAANPWGGNYTVAVSTNVSQFDVTITNLPTERIYEIGDALAPISADRCSSSDSCSSLDISGSQITVTF
ncbi:hypothetical protein A6E01_20670 (plasmid) [Vibrio breoganii]|uniref:Prepilin-type N-terminal cleavage/methylation domain-containing protein n=1 Tax=Vibrio breoganii TaxID=553239 RepID=A0AAN0Y038_9VIBR|nr:prepilin-type N-terminal cleavage/methylation domain-containing protein [Vibrio breoganii]ANO35627.1 hypothetical protein A6E01_20670 [Vibrio breoganii]